MTATHPTAKEALLKRAAIALERADHYQNQYLALKASAKILRDKFYCMTAADVDKNATRAYDAAEDMRREHAELIKQADEHP